MAKTTRLGLPIVTLADAFDVNLWNDGYTTIDQKCLTFEMVSTFNYPANQKEHQVEIQDRNYFFLELLPGNPENQTQWNLLSLASIRSWYNSTDKKLYLCCEGQIPTQDISIQVLGWF